MKKYANVETLWKLETDEKNFFVFVFVFVFVYLIAAHAVTEGETHAGTGFLAHGIDTLAWKIMALSCSTYRYLSTLITLCPKIIVSDPDPH
jgi:hypothetical protein